MEGTVRGSEDVIAIGKEAGRVGRGTSWDVKNVPDVGGYSEGRPLEG